MLLRCHGGTASRPFGLLLAKTNQPYFWLSPAQPAALLPPECADDRYRLQDGSYRRTPGSCSEEIGRGRSCPLHRRPNGLAEGREESAGLTYKVDSLQGWRKVFAAASRPAHRGRPRRGNASGSAEIAVPRHSRASRRTSLPWPCVELRTSTGCIPTPAAAASS